MFKIIYIFVAQQGAPYAMAWHATFQHFHSAHATGPQQSLQITTTWSMQLKATHATNKQMQQSNNQCS